MKWDMRPCILIQRHPDPLFKELRRTENKADPGQRQIFQGMGIQPDILVCRSDYPLDDGIKRKIAIFCNVGKERVIQNLDAEVLYEVPLMMENGNIWHMRPVLSSSVSGTGFFSGAR